MIKVALINPKSPDNVGSVLRACGCFGANQVLYTGSRYHFAKQYRTDTQNRHTEIQTQKVDELLDVMAKEPRSIVIELVENATPLPEFQHPDNALYIFGPEDGSVPQDIIDAATDVVYIPTDGCLNLAATANVVLYDRLVKTNGKFETDNSLILTSRDNNNTTRRDIRANHK